MNKKIILIAIGTLVLGAGAFFAWSFFKGSSKHLALVPKNATVLIRIDVKSLAEKLYANGDLKKTKLFQKMEKESSKNSSTSSKVLSQILKEPTSIGVNVFSPVYYYMNNTKEADYNGFVFDIKDLDDFNSTVLKFPESKEKLKKDNDLSYIKFSEREILVWNKSGVLFLNVDRWSYDESSTKPIEEVAKGYMSQDKESSIMSDKDFMSYNDNNDDISMYFSYDKFSRALKLRGVGSDDNAENVSKMLSGIAVGMGVEFEDDAIVMKSKMLGDEAAIAKLNYMRENGLSDQGLSVICKDQLLAMLGLNFDLDKLITMAGEISGEDVKIRQNIERMAGEIGLTSKQLISAIGFELSLALVGFEEGTKSSYDYTIDEMTGMFEPVQVTEKFSIPVMTMSLAVNDKSTIDRILSKLGVQMGADGSAKVPLQLYDSSNLYLILKDKMLFMSNSATMASQVKNNGTLGEISNSSVKDLVKDNPMSFYVDLDIKKYGALTSALEGEAGKQTLTYIENYMAMFKDIRGSYKNNESEFRINLNKGDGNSLFRLVKQVDELPVETW